MLRTMYNSPSPSGAIGFGHTPTPTHAPLSVLQPFARVEGTKAGREASTSPGINSILLAAKTGSIPFAAEAKKKENLKNMFEVEHIR